MRKSLKTVVASSICWEGVLHAEVTAGVAVKHGSVLLPAQLHAGLHTPGSHQESRAGQSKFGASFGLIPEVRRWERVILVFVFVFRSFVILELLEPPRTSLTQANTWSHWRGEDQQTATGGTRLWLAPGYHQVMVSTTLSPGYG